MSKTAFEKFLMSVPKDMAVEHVVDCLVNGPKDNMAWALMEKYLGDQWHIDPLELRFTINTILSKLEDGCE